MAEYDPAYRFVVPVDAAVEPETYAYKTGTDGVGVLLAVGRVDLAGIGSLDVWWLDSYGGGIFVPVRDATAGRSTYGAAVATCSTRSRARTSAATGTASSWT